MDTFTGWTMGGAIGEWSNREVLGLALPLGHQTRALLQTETGWPPLAPPRPPTLQPPPPLDPGPLNWSPASGPSCVPPYLDYLHHTFVGKAVVGIEGDGPKP